MGLLVGKPAPNFSLEGTSGTLSLADLKGAWAILFFYPKAGTSVCQSEVVGFNEHYDEFANLGAKIVGISVDSLDTLKQWVQQLGGIRYPLLSDASYEVSRNYEVFSEEAQVAFRGLFIIDPEGKVRYQVVQEPFFGRSTKEVKRILQALQRGEACMLDWEP